MPRLEHLQPAAPLYVTFDLDELDPAPTPGVSHRLPGRVALQEAALPAE